MKKENKYVAWLRPHYIVLLGTIAAILLLITPIYIGPGDHENNTSCGNALNMDLGPWQRNLHGPDGKYYFDLAHKSCTTDRIDRISKAVGVLSLTALIAALLAARELRNSPLSKKNH